MQFTILQDPIFLKFAPQANLFRYIPKHSSIALKFSPPTVLLLAVPRLGERACLKPIGLLWAQMGQYFRVFRNLISLPIQARVLTNYYSYVTENFI